MNAEKTPVRRRLRRPPPFRRPWLVTFRDFRRYLGRALDACDRGHVLFFLVRGMGGRRELFALVPYSNWEQRLTAAMAAYHDRRFRQVTLADLPRTKRKITG